MWNHLFLLLLLLARFIRASEHTSPSIHIYAHILGGLIWYTQQQQQQQHRSQKCINKTSSARKLARSLQVYYIHTLSWVELSLAIILFLLLLLFLWFNLESAASSTGQYLILKWNNFHFRRVARVCACSLYVYIDPLRQARLRSVRSFLLSLPRRIQLCYKQNENENNIYMFIIFNYMYMYIWTTCRATNNKQTLVWTPLPPTPNSNLKRTIKNYKRSYLWASGRSSEMVSWLLFVLLLLLLLLLLRFLFSFIHFISAVEQASQQVKDHAASEETRKQSFTTYYTQKKI